jgi:HSP20 family protein
MAGLIPFNRRNLGLTRESADLDSFYNLLDDFFSDGLMPERNLLHDTFKIDIEEKENEYIIDAELPGVKKEEVDISVDEENLCISINRAEEKKKDGKGEDGKNYLHRERRISSMSRRIRLVDAKLDEIKAKLKDGVLSITIPKNIKPVTTRKINIE